MALLEIRNLKKHYPVRSGGRAARLKAVDGISLAISFVVFGTNLLGDALRDILDPRQRS